jgi:hypothetical protein
MADRPNSINFWSSVAARYKGNPAVLFELFNEPFLDAGQLTNASTLAQAGGFLLNGGGAVATLLWDGGNTTNVNWTTAGYQEMLNAVRAAGAPNVVLVGTMDWTATMDQWLPFVPSDTTRPAGYTGTWTPQLGATWHAYPASQDGVNSDAGLVSQVTCLNLPSCSAQMMTAVQGIIAAGYPVVITEFGDTITNSGSAAPWASVLLPWSDTNGVSYLGWTFNPWPGFSNDVMVTDLAGTPTPGYGAYVQQHYLCMAAGSANCP